MKKKLILIIFSFILINNLTLITCYAQWGQCNISNANYILCFTHYNNTLFAGNGTGLNGIFRSTNNGDNWALSLLGPGSFVSIGVKGNDIFTLKGFGNCELYKSTNIGVNWNLIYQKSYVNSMCIHNNDIYLGTSYSIFKSTNNGLNFFEVGNGFDTLHVHYIYSYNNLVLAGTYFNGMYLTSNDGLTWIQVNNNLPPNSNIYAIYGANSNIYIGTNIFGGSIYYSSNNGLGWNNIHYNLDTRGVYAITNYYDKLFIGTDSGVYMLNNINNTWIKKNQGFGASKIIYSLYVYNNYIYAGVKENTMWRRLLSNIINIQNISTDIPSYYELAQNYPNPFNPNTKIKINVVKNEDVKINVYDISGKELEVIVNERMQPGTYEVEWNGGKYASGIYFYRMEVEGYIETRKMVLMK